MKDESWGGETLAEGGMKGESLSGDCGWAQRLCDVRRLSGST